MMRFVDDDGQEITPLEWAEEIVERFDGLEDADRNCSGIWALAQSILNEAPSAPTAEELDELAAEGWLDDVLTPEEAEAQEAGRGCHLRAGLLSLLALC